MIADGSYCDDDTLKEYYAGILASSRTNDTKDDIGVSLLSLLKGLSVYQVRLHYLFYHEFYKLYRENPVSLGEPRDRDKRRLFFPYSTVNNALLHSTPFASPKLIHAVTGLVRNDLLGPQWLFGEPTSLTQLYKEADCPGLVIQPSLTGIELFAWANGQKEGDLVSPIDFLFSSPLDTDMKFNIIPGARSTFNS